VTEIEDWSAEPERFGLDAAALKRADAIVRAGMDEGVYPAATYIVLRRGKIVARNAMGLAQPHVDPPVATELTTVFDMASLTKPVAATLLLQMIERGDLHLGMRVLDLLPEAADAPVGPVTLFQLATHTSGLPAWKPLYMSDLGGAIAEILATELEAQPGTRYAYCDLGYILIGEIIARRAGVPLDRLAQERIFAPAGMSRTGYLPTEDMRGGIAATANCPMREGQTLVGDVHDANAHSMGGVSGHAGLFSTASDMARFAVALFHREEATRLGIPPLLRPAALRLTATRQTDPAVSGHSIGHFTMPNSMLPKGDLLSSSTFGHTGFTGTLILHDPEQELTLLLLTNRVWNPEDGTGIGRIRRLFANAVAGGIV